MAQTYDEEFIHAMRRGIEEMLPEWGLPRESEVALLNISENATFLAQTPTHGHRIIIRVNRPGYHTKQEIESELHWVEHLRLEQVVRTARPLELKSGGRIGSLTYLDEPYMVVGFDFLPGKEPSPEHDLREHFHTLGAITAKLHKHSRGWVPPVGFKRKIWDFDAMLGSLQLWGNWRQAIGLELKHVPLLEKVATLLEKQLAVYGKDRGRFGLIHADIRLANILIDNDDLGVIDFDDCGYSWFMYDFAAAISFMEEDEQISSLQESWLIGYRSISEIHPDDEKMLPTFIMLRRMLLTAWLASHSETETAKEIGAGYTMGTVRLAQQYLESSANR